MGGGELGEGGVDDEWRRGMVGAGGLVHGRVDAGRAVVEVVDPPVGPGEQGRGVGEEVLEPVAGDPRQLAAGVLAPQGRDFRGGIKAGVPFLDQLRSGFTLERGQSP